MTSKQNTNVSFWNRIAFLYSKFMKKNDGIYHTACEKIAPFLNESFDVLELACGTGQFSYTLAKKSKSYIATDFSSKMVEQTEKNYTGDKARFEVQDATKLTYNENSFDVVLIANALHVMPNPELAMSEIQRVLKPNGLLIAPTFVFDKHTSKLRIWILEHIGFRTYNKWDSVELVDFVARHSFEIVSSETIHDSSLSKCILIAKNNVKK